MPYDVMIISNRLSSLGQHVANFFNADVVNDVTVVAQKVATKNYRVLVLDEVETRKLDLTECEALLKVDFMQSMPLVVLSSSYDVKDKIKALEIGCDDFVDSHTEPDEVCARITKSIFHQIANAQLSQRLAQATEMARNAMVDNSDLGANIQFLLQVHQCNNLDELGQQFFATIERYGLSCSLQMRSAFETKNMEAHGMGKDLESQMLWQLKDKGRYVDFGRRSIINYDRVSLLIKNMPDGDAEKYGAIKDNTFCLAQGINARVIALEDRHKLIDEKESMRKLSSDVNLVIATLKHSYQEVMSQIVNEVEHVTEAIQHRVPHLALNEEDEAFLDNMTEGLVLTTNSTFNEGLKVNELFERLERAVQRSLDSVAEPAQTPVKEEKNNSGGNTVELF